MPSETVILDLDASQYEAALKRVAEVSERYDGVQREVAAGNKEIEKAFMRTLTAADRSALTLVKLEAATSDAGKETAAFQETQDKLLRTVNSQVDGSKRFTAAMQTVVDVGKQATVAYDAQTKGLDNIQKAMNALGIPGARMITSVKDISESMKGMAGESANAAKVLKAGIIAGAVVAGIAALAAGFVSLTANAAEWDDELRKVGLGLDEVSHKQLQDHADALETTKFALKSLGVAIAREVGPAVEEGARSWSILWLAMSDGFGKDLFEYGQQLDDVTDRLRAQKTATKSLADSISLTAAISQMGVEAAQEEDAFRAKLLATARDERIARLDGIPAIVAERDAKLQALTEERRALLEHGDLSVATVEAYERARAEIIRTTEARIADERATAAEEAAKEDEQRFAERGQRVRDALEAEAQAQAEAEQAWWDGIQAQADAEQTLFIQQVKSAEARAKAEAQAAAAAQRSWGSSFASIGASAQTFSTILAEQSKRAGDQAHKAAVAVFRVNQAAAVTGIAINTAQAIMQALANLPPPASYVAAGAAALAGAAQAAAVLAQSPPSPAGPGSISVPTAPTAPSIDTSQGGGGGGIDGQGGGNGGGGSGAADAGAEDDTSGAEEHQELRNDQQVTDAFFGPSSSAQFVRTTPGDTVDIERGGAKRRRDAAMLSEMRATRLATERQTVALEALRMELLYRRHVDATTTPARGY